MNFGSTIDQRQLRLPGGAGCVGLALALGLLLAGGDLSGQINTANMTPQQLKALVLSQPRIDVVSPVAPTAAFDPPVVRPGQLATYRVTLDALEPSIEWPERIVAPGLDLLPRARGQILINLGDRYLPRMSFTYRVRPLQTGQFVIPGFSVVVYGKPVAIPEARLEVTTAVTPARPPAQLLLLKVLDSTNLYVGEAVRAQVLLPGEPDGRIQFMEQVRLGGEGFVVDQTTAQQRVERLTEASGASVPAFVHEVSFTPIAAGKLSLIGQGFAAGNRISGNVVIVGPTVIPGGPPPYTLLDSEPVEIRVRPLPREGQLPGFTGAVGSYRVDPPVLATNVLRAGDSVKLSVRVHGEAGLGRLPAPPSPRTRDWQVFPLPPDNVPPQVLHAQGFTTLSYTLIPRSDEVRATPAIPFSCFDPHRGVYMDLTIPSVPVTVRPAATPVETEVFRRAWAGGGPEESEPVLSGLAAAPGGGARSLAPLQLQGWFPALQLAPAVAFLALWGWDRRRRFFERHPDELLRRKARRAVRREKRRVAAAARERREEEFGHRAIALMRLACAPHYPAEPRALVGADVLALFEEPDRLGRPGEVVRAFFQAGDAAEFSGRGDAPKDLLGLRQDFARVVELLEARLAPRAAGNGQGTWIRRRVPWLFLAAVVILAPDRAGAGVSEALFDTGLKAYRDADYALAAKAFAQAAESQPASGTFQNLGNAEWQRGRTGFAVLAWEQALWLNPFDSSARGNLRFVRKAAQLESPELAWYEVVSSWLPANWWAWIAGLSFWGAVAAVMLPGIFRLRKSAWQQAAAALGLALFLLSLPAHFGVITRSRLGFVCQKDTPLRLTPTDEAQAVTHLAAGEPARLQRVRGKYVLVSANRAAGWLLKDEFGLVCPR